MAAESGRRERKGGAARAHRRKREGLPPVGDVCDVLPQRQPHRRRAELSRPRQRGALLHRDVDEAADDVDLQRG